MALAGGGQRLAAAACSNIKLAATHLHDGPRWHHVTNAGRKVASLTDVSLVLELLGMRICSAQLKEGSWFP